MSTTLGCLPCRYTVHEHSGNKKCLPPPQMPTLAARLDACTLLSFIATYMSWHTMTPPAAKPSTPSCTASHRSLTQTLTLTQVTSTSWGAVGVAIICREVLPRGLTWYTTHAMPRHPPRRHGILWHAMGCNGDAMVCHWWYVGHSSKRSNSVEPCLFRKTAIHVYISTAMLRERNTAFLRNSSYYT